MVIPILKASLSSLARDRIDRLGGVEKITLHDLAREVLQGSGDTGICFEYAVFCLSCFSHFKWSDEWSHVRSTSSVARRRSGERDRGKVTPAAMTSPASLVGARSAPRES